MLDPKKVPVERRVKMFETKIFGTDKEAGLVARLLKVDTDAFHDLHVVLEKYFHDDFVKEMTSLDFTVFMVIKGFLKDVFTRLMPVGEKLPAELDSKGVNVIMGITLNLGQAIENRKVEFLKHFEKATIVYNDLMTKAENA